MFSQRIKTHHSAMASGNKYLLGVKNVEEVLSSPNESAHEKNATIYIHVPFCKKICSFCNMRRSLQEPSTQYADLIVREIENYGKFNYIQDTVFDAVYFGGGTPTTLSGEALAKILKALKHTFRLTANAEITIETTVTELTSEKIKTLVAAGVNRFSVGIQTFDEEGRKLMGRVGSGTQAYKKLKELKSYENVTVSMDLIYNYPKQTMASLYSDLDKIIALDLDGFSMYSLINMKETAIEGAQSQENDEVMFFAISEYMKKAGYNFLELTKMVKKDAYKYISNRHQGADTLPLGAGAGGSIGGLAMMNPIKLEEYEKSVQEFNTRSGMHFKSDYKQVVKFKGDLQMLYLPKNESLYKERMKYEEVLEQLVTQEMVVPEATYYRLTTKGIFWGNTISRQLSLLI
nr:radical SAM protein [uncultured Cellulosilyticum sp.]